MIKTSIAFLDSGIGGLPYLAWIDKRRPELSLSYIADTANFPYGELSKNHLIYAVVQIAEKIFTQLAPELLAIVCNTASVSALREVRRIAPCPVVGTVPAVKSAVRGKSRRSIVLLATQNTVNSPYVDRLIKAFASDRNVIRVAAGDIVRFVEEDWLSQGVEGAERIIQQELGYVKVEDPESLIIGCTHFLHIAEPIKSFFGNVDIIDSREGVGKRILSLHAKPPSANPRNRFFVSESGDMDESYCSFAKRFGLEWGGLIR